MKQLFMVVLVLLLALAVKPVWAAEGGEKGASREAYEHASEQSIFNRISDWFATIGKSPEEKAVILQERQRQRAEQRAEKQIEKAQREEKRLKKQQLSGDSEMQNRTRAKNRIENRIKTGGAGKGKR